MLTRTFENENSDLAVQVFNSVLFFLERECITSLDLVNAQELGTCKHFLNQYEWLTQSYLRRMINLGRNYADMLHKDENLAAGIIARSIIETLAHFHFFLNEIVRLVEAGKSAEAYQLIGSYMLGGSHDFLPSHVKIQNLRIGKSLKEANKAYPEMEKHYNWLCNFVHPNSPGTLAFTEDDYANNKINFFKKPVDLRPDVVTLLWFATFKQEWERLVGVRTLIVDKWQSIPASAVTEKFTA